jgi:hypothetical protein
MLVQQPTPEPPVEMSRLAGQHTGGVVVVMVPTEAVQQVLPTTLALGQQAPPMTVLPAGQHVGGLPGMN